MDRFRKSGGGSSETGVDAQAPGQLQGLHEENGTLAKSSRNGRAGRTVSATGRNVANREVSVRVGGNEDATEKINLPSGSVIRQFAAASARGREIKQYGNQTNALPRGILSTRYSNRS